MKLFSLKNIITNTLQTFLRFPIAILSAVAGVFVSIYLTELRFEDNNEMEKAYMLLFTFALGLSLFIFLQLFIERKKFKKSVQFLIKAAGILLMVGYYLSMPEKIEEVTTIRFLLINFSLHCFIAVAPFFLKNELTGFWNFNKTLFVRILLSVLYSGVLYLGLVLAMLAADELFGLKIDADRYYQLWIIITGIILTWIFLAGIPKNFQELETTDKYPLGLKIFTQYILLPLVLLYILILYIYAGKILINWDWPVGWVSVLILSFSVMGIFSLLLLYPIRNNENNKWIKIYTKLFYFVLIPLIGLLILATWRRISEYGITESRYYLIVLTIWLAGITIYQIFNKFGNIKIIPVSLGILALLSSFGPWGAFSISKNSQFNRLKKTLSEYNILVNNKVVPNKNIISFKDQQDITSMVEYLNQMHGYQTFQPIFNVALDSIIVDSVYINPTDTILGLIGVEYLSMWQTEDSYLNDFYFSGRAYYEEVINITGYDYQFDYNQYFYNYSSPDETMYSKTFSVDSIKIVINFDTLSTNYIVNINETEPLTFDLSEIVKQLDKKVGHGQQYDIPSNDLVFEKENSRFKIRIQLKNLSGTKSDNRITFNEINASIYMGLKKESN
ncbi:MAG: DUF4153 domain-containing protein [Bacteroidota bacterium]